MAKKITMFSYIYSIFKKDGMVEMTNQYNKYMINNFLFSTYDSEIMEIIKDLNNVKYQHLTNQEHYEIVYNMIAKGFYTLPKKLITTYNTEWRALKLWLHKFSKSNDLMKISDITHIMSLMSDDELDDLYKKIETLQKEG